MEATGHARWFERLLAELEFELWVGDPAQFRARRDAFRDAFIIDESLPGFVLT
jgi:hypothetical protein